LALILLPLLSKSQTMKKITLLLVAAVMISGGAYAQDKGCCKKGGQCPKGACCKDKKSPGKETTKNTMPAKAPEAAKKAY
jgi:hypothetical protein